MSKSLRTWARELNLDRRTLRTWLEEAGFAMPAVRRGSKHLVSAEDLRKALALHRPAPNKELST